MLRPMTRRRSVVSFKLTPSLGEEQSTDGEGDSDKEEHLYLPTNVRSIEETFDAWQESFKRPESRTSMFSSGCGSPYPNTPQIMEEEEKALDTHSNSSVYSAQDIAMSHEIRPVSRMSFVSGNSESTLSAEVRSRVSSASSVSLTLETASQSGFVQKDLNVDDESEKKSLGVDEMSRSLSSVVSFISEHGQVARSSRPVENFSDEPVQPLSKDVEENSFSVSNKVCTVEFQPIAANSSNAENISTTEAESEQDVSASGVVIEENESVSVLEREVIATSMGTDENASTVGVESEQDASTTSIGISEEHLFPVGNDNDEVITEVSDEGKVPSIVETTCTDDEEAEDREIAVSGSSVELNSEANSVNEESSKSIPVEVVSEELSETTEDLPDVEERFSLADVENSTVDRETEMQGENGEELGKSIKGEEKPSELGEPDCLHCQSISKRKVTVPIESKDESIIGEDSLLSKVLNSSSEPEEVSRDQYGEQKDTENESTATEEISTELDLNSEVGVQGSKSAIEESEEETVYKDNLSELQDSQKDSEPQDIQTVCEPQESQERENDSQDEDEDGEGGYTSEASATTLQGIRGVLGRRRQARCSTAATTVGFDVDDESTFSEDGFDTEEKPYDLATKEGLDAFKEFLLDTSGEKMLQFWLEVESGRHIDGEDEKNRFV